MKRTLRVLIATIVVCLIQLTSRFCCKGTNKFQTLGYLIYTLNQAEYGLVVLVCVGTLEYVSRMTQARLTLLQARNAYADTMKVRIRDGVQAIFVCERILKFHKEKFVKGITVKDRRNLVGNCQKNQNESVGTCRIHT